MMKLSSTSMYSLASAGLELMVKHPFILEGIMISAQDFGFGFMTLTDEQLEMINKLREGMKHDDEEAAVKIKGSVLKNPLTCQPFTEEFFYGANKEGYWSYEHLTVQLEDCMDVLKALYPVSEYEFQFLVDHSCGHCRQREDGLIT